MINLIVSAPQTVAAGAIITYPAERAKTRGGCMCNGGWLYHAEDSGMVTIGRPGIYKVSFTAQAAASAAGAVTAALQTGGETLSGAVSGGQAAAAGDLVPLAIDALVVVPCGASVVLSIANTSAAAITINAASMVITRQC